VRRELVRQFIQGVYRRPVPSVGWSYLQQGLALVDGHGPVGEPQPASRQELEAGADTADGDTFAEHGRHARVAVLAARLGHRHFDRCSGRDVRELRRAGLSDDEQPTRRLRVQQHAHSVGAQRVRGKEHAFAGERVGPPPLVRDCECGEAERSSIGFEIPDSRAEREPVWVPLARRRQHGVDHGALVLEAEVSGGHGSQHLGPRHVHLDPAAPARRRPEYRHVVVVSEPQPLPRYVRVGPTDRQHGPAVVALGAEHPGPHHLPPGVATGDRLGEKPYPAGAAERGIGTGLESQAQGTDRADLVALLHHLLEEADLGAHHGFGHRRLDDRRYGPRRRPGPRVGHAEVEYRHGCRGGECRGSQFPPRIALGGPAETRRPLLVAELHRLGSSHYATLGDPLVRSLGAAGDEAERALAVQWVALVRQEPLAGGSRLLGGPAPALVLGQVRGEVERGPLRERRAAFAPAYGLGAQAQLLVVEGDHEAQPKEALAVCLPRQRLPTRAREKPRRRGRGDRRLVDLRAERLPRGGQRTVRAVHCLVAVVAQYMSEDEPQAGKQREVDGASLGLLLVPGERVDEIGSESLDLVPPHYGLRVDLVGRAPGVAGGNGQGLAHALHPALMARELSQFLQGPRCLGRSDERHARVIGAGLTVGFPQASHERDGLGVGIGPQPPRLRRELALLVGRCGSKLGVRRHRPPVLS